MKRSALNLGWLIVLCLIVVTGGCSNQRFSNWDPDDYTVKSGDTLYSIAWRYEIDPDELARWNRLNSPYLIHPGDRLHTNGTDSKRPVVQADAGSRKSRSTGYSGSSSKNVIIVQKGDTLYSLAKRHHMTTNQLAGSNELRPPYSILPGQKLYLRKPPVVLATKSKSRSKSAPKLPNTADSFSNQHRTVKWLWPVKGKIVNRFNSKKNDAKGIDIAGNIGTDVKAAASGKVVYSGNGLISYGNLLIIKHSQSYLSAYAHNRKLLVKEGTVVKAGQKIAELGKSGTEKPKLHFEIRKNGKPVDPLRYLPSS